MVLYVLVRLVSPCVGGVWIWSNNPSERVLVLVSEGALCTYRLSVFTHN